MDITELDKSTMDLADFDKSIMLYGFKQLILELDGL